MFLKFTLFKVINLIHGHGKMALAARGVVVDWCSLE